MSKSQNKYWTTDQIQVVGEGPEGPFVVNLNRPYALIGAHPKADISLQGEGVSRRHLYVHIADGRIFGIYLDQDREQGKFGGSWIVPDMVVRVGPYRLNIGFVDGQPLAAESDTKRLTESSRKKALPVLHWQSDRAELGRHRLTRRLSILGRAKACALQFTTRSISAEHCLFFRQDESMWVVNLSRAGKTLVNGKSVSCAKLGPNEEVELGRVRLRLQMPGQEMPGQEMPGQEMPGQEMPGQEMPASNRGGSTSQLPSDSANTRVNIHDKEHAGEDHEIPQSDHRKLEVASSNESCIDTIVSQRPTASNGDSVHLEIQENAAADNRGPSDGGAVGTVLGQSPQQLEQLLKAIERQQMALDTRTQELNAIAETLETQSKSIAGDSASLQERFVKQEAAEKALRQQQLEALADERTQFDRKLLQLKTDQQQLDIVRTEQTAELARREAELVQRLGEFEQRKQEFAQEQSRWQTQQTESDTTIEKLTAERTAIEKLRTELTAERTAIEKLRTELTAERTAIEKQRTEQTAERTAIEELRTELTAERTAIEKLREQQAAELERPDAELAQRLHDFNKLEREFAQAQSHWQAQQSELDATIEGLTAERTAIEKLREQQAAELKRRDAELAQRRDDFNKLEREFAQAQSHWQAQQSEFDATIEGLTAEHRETVALLKSELSETRRATQVRQKELGEEAADLANRQAEMESQQQEWLAAVQTQEQDELRKVNERLARRQPRKGERPKIEENLRKQAKQLVSEQPALDSACKRLEVERKELERFQKVDSSQREVLINLGKLNREKSSIHRFFQRLTGPFRRSN